MPSDRPPSLILPVAVTLTVLLGLYVGAYYAMVRPDDRIRGLRARSHSPFRTMSRRVRQ